MVRITRRIILVWFFVAENVAGNQVTVISIVIGRNPMYGFYAAGPVFDVAFEAINKTHPEILKNTTRHGIYKPETASNLCGDTDAVMHETLGEVVKIVTDTKGFAILLSSGKLLTLVATR